MYTQISKSKLMMPLLVTLLMVVASLVISPITLQAQTDEDEMGGIDVVWLAEYYDNPIFEEPAAVTREEEHIAYDWGLGSPDPAIPNDRFSVRWSTDVFLSAGTYRFYALADDNISITVDFADAPQLDTFEIDGVGEVVTADILVLTGEHHIQVDYREITEAAYAYVAFVNVNDATDEPPFATPEIEVIDLPNWSAQYYRSTDLNGAPAVNMIEPTITRDWEDGFPAPGIPVDNWSARWNTTVTLEETDDYRVQVFADDGVRVFIDGILVIDEWHSARGEVYEVERRLVAGNHTLTVEFFEERGVAFLDFQFARITAEDDDELINVTATVTAGRLNVRDIPDAIDGDILMRISNGETFQVLGRNASDTWVQIDVDGIPGWVNKRFVDLSQNIDLPVVDGTAPEVVDDPTDQDLNLGDINPTAEPTGYIVTATPFTVNVRTGPGTNFDDIADLREGETAVVIGRNAAASWWQVEFDGIVGWVSARFAVIERGAVISDIPVTD